MTPFKRCFVYFLLAGCVAYPAVSPADSCSYGQKVGQKAGLAFANLSTSLLEIPKGIVKTTNESNVIYGMSGGLFKGLVNTLGRMGVGTLDLMTLLIPTKPVAYPLHVWDNFDIDTSYGDIMRFDFCKPVAAAGSATAIPEPQTVVEPVPVAAPAQPAVNNLGTQQINPKLDTLFKNQMMK